LLGIFFIVVKQSAHIILFRYLSIIAFI